MGNTVSNVTTGKPNINGAIWRGPIGSTLPTSAETSIDTTVYSCLGFCADDGLTNSNTPSTEQIKAWGGETVLTPTAERPDKYKWKALEATNVEVLKAAYGTNNVSGTLETGIVVRHNATDQPAAVYIIDTILTGGTKKRIVIPNGTLTSLEDIVYKDNEALAYGVEITANTGGFGGTDPDTSKEYIKKPATT